MHRDFRASAIEVYDLDANNFMTRLRYTKQGDLRWIGHRDLVRTLTRWFRRAGLRLGMTKGFHPGPRMSFPLAIPLGIEGRNEIIEFGLAEMCGEQELRARLEPDAPEGLTLRRIEIFEEGTRKLRVPVTSCAYLVTSSADCAGALQNSMTQRATPSSAAKGARQWACARKWIGSNCSTASCTWRSRATQTEDCGPATCSRRSVWST